MCRDERSRWSRRGLMRHMTTAHAEREARRVHKKEVVVVLHRQTESPCGQRATTSMIGGMRPRPLPLELLDSPFARRRALELGVAPGRLRASDRYVPHRGVRSPARASTLVWCAADALPLLLEGEWFSHVTALSLWGLPLSARWEAADLHVAGTRRRQLRRPGLVGHRLVRQSSRRTVSGLPVSSPLQAWVESASLLALDELVQVGDALAGRWSPHAAARRLPMSALAETVSLARARRRPGAVRLGQAMSLVRERVDSPRETLLRLQIVRAGRPEPEVNVRRLGSDGSWLGRPDLSYPDEKVVVDFEGDGHRTDRRQWETDVDRRERFVDDGWAYLRVTNQHLGPPRWQQFLTRLDRELGRHGASQ